MSRFLDYGTQGGLLPDLSNLSGAGEDKITSIVEAGASPITTLTGLSDTTLDNPAEQQVLRHDGIDWKNAQLGLNDLSDAVRSVSSIGLGNQTASADDNNTIVGVLAAPGLTAGGVSNSCFGYNTAGSLTTGARNTCVGINSGASMSGNGNLVMGSDADTFPGVDGAVCIGEAALARNTDDICIGRGASSLTLPGGRHLCVPNDLSVSSSLAPNTRAVVFDTLSGEIAPLPATVQGEVLTAQANGGVSWQPPADKSIGDLTDVTITAPAAGELLTYDLGTTSWVNTPAPVAVESLNDLSDASNTLTASISLGDTVAGGLGADNVILGIGNITNGGLDTVGNVAIGRSVGNTLTAGDNNVLIGINADVQAGTQSDCIIIGRNGRCNATDGSISIGALADGSTLPAGKRINVPPDLADFGANPGRCRVMLYDDQAGEVGPLADTLTPGQVLTSVNQGEITWADVPETYVSPLTTNGDLLTRVAGVDSRLGIGLANQVLVALAGQPVWRSPTLNTLTDVSVPAPADGSYLAYNAAVPQWEPRQIAAATDTSFGLVELATAAEAAEGTANTVITCATLAPTATRVSQSETELIKISVPQNEFAGVSTAQPTLTGSGIGTVFQGILNSTVSFVGLSANGDPNLVTIGNIIIDDNSESFPQTHISNANYRWNIDLGAIKAIDGVRVHLDASYRPQYTTRIINIYAGNDPGAFNETAPANLTGLTLLGQLNTGTAGFLDTILSVSPAVSFRYLVLIAPSTSRFPRLIRFAPRLAPGALIRKDIDEYTLSSAQSSGLPVVSIPDGPSDLLINISNLCVEEAYRRVFPVVRSPNDIRAGCSTQSNLVTNEVVTASVVMAGSGLPSNTQATRVLFLKSVADGAVVTLPVTPEEGSVIVLRYSDGVFPATATTINLAASEIARGVTLVGSTTVPFGLGSLQVVYSGSVWAGTDLVTSLIPLQNTDAVVLLKEGLDTAVDFIMGYSLPSSPVPGTSITFKPVNLVAAPATAEISPGARTIDGAAGSVFISSAASKEPVTFTYSAASDAWFTTAGTPKAPSLSDAGDISITTPANNQMLTYNATTSRWENTAKPVILNGLGFTPIVQGNPSPDYQIKGFDAGQGLNLQNDPFVMVFSTKINLRSSGTSLAVGSNGNLGSTANTLVGENSSISVDSANDVVLGEDCLISDATSGIVMVGQGCRLQTGFTANDSIVIGRAVQAAPGRSMTIINALDNHPNIQNDNIAFMAYNRTSGQLAPVENAPSNGMVLTSNTPGSFRWSVFNNTVDAQYEVALGETAVNPTIGSTLPILKAAANGAKYVLFKARIPANCRPGGLASMRISLLTAPAAQTSADIALVYSLWRLPGVGGPLEAYEAGQVFNATMPGSGDTCVNAIQTTLSPAAPGDVLIIRLARNGGLISDLYGGDVYLTGMEIQFAT